MLKSWRHGFRHPPAWTIGAGDNQATASFLNPEPLNPFNLSTVGQALTPDVFPLTSGPAG
jgi:hypothetical protein